MMPCHSERSDESLFRFALRRLIGAEYQIRITKTPLCSPWASKGGEHHSPSFPSFTSQFNNWHGIPLTPLR